MTPDFLILFDFFYTLTLFFGVLYFFSFVKEKKVINNTSSIIFLRCFR